jgi:dihydropteroate synthase
MLKISHKERTLDFSEPRVMGILNISYDSFYDGGHYTDSVLALQRAEKMINEGADIVDVGAVSTRPGAAIVSKDAEWERIEKILPALRKHFPETMISIDTYRAQIARLAVSEGADIINDISGGQMDDQMFETIAKLDVPYILMHIQGTPQTMQLKPEYSNVTHEIIEFFKESIQTLASFGKTENIILDPGFGFGKTISHNYQLLNDQGVFKKLGYPLMVGVSRKSMIYKFLGITPDDSLNGTTVANTIALMNGADILRVHDVKEAKEAVRIVGEMKREGRSGQ